MAANPETLVKKLNRGFTSAPRDTDPSHAQIVKHFDIFSRSDAITPYRSVESGDSSASTNKIARYEYANGKLYGLSTASGTSQKLFSRELADMADATWDMPSNTNVAGVPNGLMFCDYSTTGKLYWSLGGTIASYHYADNTYSATERSIVATAQAIVHSKDDVLYVPCGNVLAKNNAGSWTDAALTFPTYFTISSLLERGNYLAIVLKPASGFGKSKLALWDRDSSLVTLSEMIDIGVESAECVGEIAGTLVSISMMPQALYGRLIFRTYTGGTAFNEPFLELRAPSTVTTQIIWKQMVSGRMYFNFDITVGTEQCIGIWAIGKNADGHLAVSIDRLYRNDGITTADVIQGFYLFADYMFVSYTDASSGNAFAMSKTDDQANYSITSVFRSSIFRTGDSSQVKKLIGVTGMFEPLAASGVAGIDYRKDGATSWTTIFNDTLDGDISHSATNIENTGANLDEEKEVEFSLNSAGGAAFTGFSFKEEWVDKRAY